MLDQKTIQAITRQVHRKFPEMAGSRPTVRQQHIPQSKSLSPAPVRQAPVYLLTFRGSASAPGGKALPRSVRVVVDAHGKVLKMTTSR